MRKTQQGAVAVDNVKKICKQLKLVNGFLGQPHKFASHTKKCYFADIVNFIVYLLTVPVDTIESATNTTVHAIESLLLEMNDIVIRGHIASLRDKKQSETTINRKVATLRSFYKYLVKQGKIDTNPVTMILTTKVEVKSPILVSSEEFNLLMSIVKPATFLGARDKLMLCLTYYAGLKAHEVVSLKMADIDFLEEKISIKKEGQPTRVVPMNGEIIGALSTYIHLQSKRSDKQALDTKMLLVNKHGTPISSRSFRRKLGTYAEKANLDKTISPESLRQSFITRLFQNGADDDTVKGLVGVSSIKSLNRFKTKTPVEEHEQVAVCS